MDQILAKFSGGIQDFQSIFQEVVKATASLQEDLTREKAKLSEERAAFEQEKGRVAQVLSDADHQISLNVGGTTFATTITTLKNAPLPSLFTAMFSGRHALKPDERGQYFIDRDSRHFHDILNFLRYGVQDGTFHYPADSTDFRYLLELRAEAEYFGLVKLIEAIDAYPYHMTTVSRATSISRGEGWCYEDGEDEIVFTLEQSVQLLGVGLCGTDGSFTAELVISEVDPNSFSNKLCKLREVACTYVNTESDTVKLMLRPPVPLYQGKHYMLSALIEGTDSYCCEDCIEAVVADGVRVHFMTYESPNGTNELRGQFPELYIRAAGHK